MKLSWIRLGVVLFGTLLRVDVARSSGSGSGTRRLKKGKGSKKSKKSSSKKMKPNIVLIVADDLSFTDVGYNGVSDFETPVLTELATSGIRLNYHYSEPDGSASRAALLTGRYAFRTGLPTSLVGGAPVEAAMNPNLDTLPHVLSRLEEYDTLMVGKWHLGYASDDHLPASKGFHQSLYVTQTDHGYETATMCFPISLATSPGLMSGELQLPPISFTIPFLSSSFPDGFCGHDLWQDTHQKFEVAADDSVYLEDLFTSRVIEFINDPTRGGDEPFFVYYPMMSPHSPLPSTTPEVYPECDQLLGSNTTPQEQERVKLCNTLKYAGSKIEQIVDALIDANVWDDTVLIFVSDNGSQPFTSILGGNAGQSLPLRGTKSTPFDGGIRVPAFINGGYLPSELSGCHYNSLTYIADWFGTILGLAGIREPNLVSNEIDAHNLWSDIVDQCTTTTPTTQEGQWTDPRTEIVSFRKEDLTNLGRLISAYVRTNDWKLIVNPDPFYYRGSLADSLAFFNQWVSFDSQFAVEPDLDTYLESQQLGDPTASLFVSTCYDQARSSGLATDTGPLVDNDGNHIYLFAADDHIEACNQAVAQPAVVAELLAIFEAWDAEYDDATLAGDRLATKAGVDSAINSYDCDSESFAYVPWLDNVFDNDSIDWNTLWLNYVATPQQCPTPP